MLVIKNETAGDFLTASARGEGWKKKKRASSRALADVFEKKEKKNKTTSVYRLSLRPFAKKYNQVVILTSKYWSAWDSLDDSLEDQI